MPTIQLAADNGRKISPVEVKVIWLTSCLVIWFTWTRKLENETTRQPLTPVVCAKLGAFFDLKVVYYGKN